MAQEQETHDLTLQGRHRLTMTGVTEVVSFDDAAVVLQTHMGILMVHGQGLQLKQLSTQNGQTCVEGTITALVYEEPRQGGWLRRLLG